MTSVCENRLVVCRWVEPFFISFQYTKNIFNTFPLTDQLIPLIVEKVPVNGGMNLKAVTKNGLPNP